MRLEFNLRASPGKADEIEATIFTDAGTAGLERLVLLLLEKIGEQSATPPGKLYVHHKTPNAPYIVLATGFIEKTMTPAVVYKAIEVGDVFIRPRDEFFDGRFTRMLRSRRGG